MSESFANQVLPYLLAAGLPVLAAAGAYLVAWLKAKTAALGVVREVVSEVETFAARPEINLTGAEKRELALRKIAVADPNISPRRATEMIRQVLPEVRESLPPPEPPPETDRDAPTPPRGREEMWPPAPTTRPLPPRRRG
jgi:hypothetical protein